MRDREFCLDFTVQSGIIYPRDPHLHKLALEFCEKELNDKVNFADFNKIVLSCEIDENDIPVRVTSIACAQVVVDWPVIRYTKPEAGPRLFARIRSYLQDQGLSGALTFFHIADREPDESRCPEWRKSLKDMKAEKASRVQVRV